MMIVNIAKDRFELGARAAAQAAQILRDVIKEKGEARIVLSTGASQFDTLDALTREDVRWECVEMFHLDEYVDLPITHPASFRKYLQERFVDKLPALKAVHFVDGTKENIEELTRELRRAPIDLGLIGIGENTHIAFNDPPADFDTDEAYIIVNLDEDCKRQQMGEGWFATLDDVPKQAVSMTPKEIMKCERIISCVPYEVKRDAVRRVLQAKKVTNLIPATLLKTHPDWTLYLDSESAQDVIRY